MSLLLFVAPALLAALLSFVLTPLARRAALALGAIDHPGPRKIHSVATPRLGGLAVIGTLLMVLGALAVTEPSGFHILPNTILGAAAAGLLPVLLISILDDLRPQRAFIKLGIHLIGAMTAVALGIRLNDVIHLLGYRIEIGWLAIPISVLWLAGITNAFNLVDGLDGLSAGLALISSLSLAAVSIVTRHYDMAATAAVLAGALVGFLPYNLYPAKLYLGDSGATAIGFFLGCLTLGGGSTTSSGLAVTLPIVVLGVPVAETVISMARRLVNRRAGGTGVFEPDGQHFHHRLLALGFDHRKAVITLYGAGVLLAGAAFASLFLKQQDAGLLLATLLLAAIVGVSKLGYDEFAVVRNGVVLRFYNVPVLRQGLFVVFADLAMIAAALYAAIGLKYDDWSVTVHRDLALSLLPLLAAVTLTVFAMLQIYKRAWSNANIDDMARASVAVLSAVTVTYVIARLTAPEPISATFFVTYGLVLLVLINGGRGSYRLLSHWNRKSNRNGEPVVIYGAGRGGALALREILTNRDVPMRPIGFIDDDPAKHGRLINGYPVIGSLQVLEDLCAEGKVRGVVLASEKIAPRNVHLASLLSAREKLWIRRFRVDFHDADWGMERPAAVGERLTVRDRRRSSGNGPSLVSS